MLKIELSQETVQVEKGNHGQVCNHVGEYTSPIILMDIRVTESGPLVSTHAQLDTAICSPRVIRAAVPGLSVSTSIKFTNPYRKKVHGSHIKRYIA